VECRVHHSHSREDDNNLADDQHNPEPVTLHDLCAHTRPHKPMRNHSANRLSAAKSLLSMRWIGRSARQSRNRQPGWSPAQDRARSNQFGFRLIDLGWPKGICGRTRKRGQTGGGRPQASGAGGAEIVRIIPDRKVVSFLTAKPTCAFGYRQRSASVRPGASADAASER
jgi:hypothetical protein